MRIFEKLDITLLCQKMWTDSRNCLQEARGLSWGKKDRWGLMVHKFYLERMMSTSCHCHLHCWMGLQKQLPAKTKTVPNLQNTYPSWNLKEDIEAALCCSAVRNHQMC